ncbi:MAG TPA: hypothetical protein EYQ53_06050 [Candidatus Poseidoniales archaeon]|jgi:trk system potassium uptake protein TrkA|nr:MAG: hypothetical protein CXT69_04190 [Euryarchaeota archaeon]HIG03922.1 hypothetical protein [Candidatus Poseidoniales archaeon]HIK77833.1 hypothetical protein [Candidatus Poseidoniales archaeon]
MLIVIGGAGRVGVGLAKALRSENRDVALLDNSAAAVKSAQMIDALVLHGDVTNREQLVKANIREAKVFIAATGSDELNLLSCALARHEHGRGKNADENFITICRVSNPSVAKESENGLLREWSGVDFAISPIEGSINRLKIGLKTTSFEEVIPFGHDAYIVEMKVTKDANEILFTNLREAGQRISNLPTIVGLKREHEPSAVPDANTKFMANDMIAVAAIGTRSFTRIVRLMGHDEEDFPDHPKVCVFGAGEIGVGLAKSYLEDGCEVTVIEPDLALANHLAGGEVGNNPRLDVINGDHHDKQLLKEIGLGRHDIAVAGLSDDHASIAVAVLAESLGVRRTGLVLQDADLVSVVKKMGITFAVNKKRVAVDMILAEVHDALPGPYGMLDSIPDIVGAIMPLSDEEHKPDLTIEKLKLPSWTKVAFIQRLDPDGGRVTLSANASKLLHEGDRLLCFLPPDRIDELKTRFSVE